MPYEMPDGTVKCIEDEIPFELSDGWAWTRLQTCCQKEIKRGKSPKYVDNSSILVFAQKCNTKYDGINMDLALYLDESTIVKYTDDEYMQDKDTVINSTGTGTLGRVGIYRKADNRRDMPVVPDSHVTVIRAYNDISTEYIYYFLKAYQQELEKLGEGSTNQKELKPLTLKNLIVALPPYAEQERVIDKINTLLSFIDTIESDKTDLQTTIQLTKSKILDLAIRGKLVPQNPDDEPASVLLDRIRAEKEELIKQGKIKRDKKESIIYKGDDNSYYLKTGRKLESIADWHFDKLPNNWGICCIGEICDYGNCINVETSYIDDSDWVLELEDIEKGTGAVLQKITKKQRMSTSTKHRFHSGQVLYSKLRPYLNKVVLADEDGYCTSEILPLDFSSVLLSGYARYYLMSPTFLSYADRCSYGVKMPRLSTTDGKKAIITIPPLAEQHRIVNAIETYFSYLDQIAESLM